MTNYLIEAVTNDVYEFPIRVFDSYKEMAASLNRSINHCQCMVSKGTLFRELNCKFIKINLEEKQLKARRTKATDISQKVKKAVWERDGGRCVVCGCSVNVMPNAHFIPRSKGGLGVEENIVTLCTEFTENKCHRKFDFGTKEEREAIGKKIERYLKAKYPNWDKNNLIYKK